MTAQAHHSGSPAAAAAAAAIAIGVIGGSALMPGADASSGFVYVDIIVPDPTELSLLDNKATGFAAQAAYQFTIGDKSSGCDHFGCLQGHRLPVFNTSGAPIQYRNLALGFFDGASQVEAKTVRDPFSKKDIAPPPPPGGLMPGIPGDIIKQEPETGTLEVGQLSNSPRLHTCIFSGDSTAVRECEIDDLKRIDFVFRFEAAPEFTTTTLCASTSDTGSLTIDLSHDLMKYQVIGAVGLDLKLGLAANPGPVATASVTIGSDKMAMHYVSARSAESKGWATFVAPAEIPTMGNPVTVEYEVAEGIAVRNSECTGDAGGVQVLVVSRPETDCLTLCNYDQSTAEWCSHGCNNAHPALLNPAECATRTCKAAGATSIQSACFEAAKIGCEFADVTNSTLSGIGNPCIGTQLYPVLEDLNRVLSYQPDPEDVAASGTTIDFNCETEELPMNMCNRATCSRGSWVKLPAQCITPARDCRPTCGSEQLDSKLEDKLNELGQFKEMYGITLTYDKSSIMPLAFEGAGVDVSCSSNKTVDTQNRKWEGSARFVCTRDNTGTTDWVVNTMLCELVAITRGPTTGPTSSPTKFTKRPTRRPTSAVATPKSAILADQEDADGTSTSTALTNTTGQEGSGSDKGGDGMSDGEKAGLAVVIFVIVLALIGILVVAVKLNKKGAESPDARPLTGVEYATGTSHPAGSAGYRPPTRVLNIGGATQDDVYASRVDTRGGRQLRIAGATQDDVYDSNAKFGASSPRGLVLDGSVRGESRSDPTLLRNAGNKHKQTMFAKSGSKVQGPSGGPPPSSIIEEKDPALQDPGFQLNDDQSSLRLKSTRRANPLFNQAQEPSSSSGPKLTSL